MNPSLLAYGALGLAIVCEVTASAFLQKSEQFSRLGPTLLMVSLYACSFYFLSHALKMIPLGVAYAIWGGLGIVLTAVVGVVVFRQTLDAAALVGIALIISGVLVMRLLSHSAEH
ncbi:MAG: multidrug efflux SMR transporter [Cystobacter sp.]